jgi:hypothetical protein
MKGTHPLVLLLALGLPAGGAGCGRVLRDRPRATVAPEEAARLLPELWRDRGDIAALDLFHGAGSAQGAPRASGPWRFKLKDTTGFSPGWDVVDESGIEWSVKQGPEAQSEVLASRLVWALGYHQPPTYYVPEWSMVDGPEAGKIQPPGRFRPTLPGAKRTGEWSWEKNPFAGTPQFRRLLVLMRVLNNWDLLDRNNTVYEFEGPREGAQRWFVVIDLGASFGKTHAVSLESGTRNDPEDYERQGYLEGVDKDGYVEFDALGKWHRELFGRIAPADVRWTSERLAGITPRQWDDAFRAAGYDKATTDRFRGEIRKRIAQGLALREAPAGEARPIEKR